MQGFILAAGKGKKIWPYSDHWQKCAMPVANVPNVLRLVNLLENLGVQRIKVIVGYKDQQVRYALRGKNVEYIECSSEGTAPALSLGLDGESIVIYGDIVVQPSDVKRVIAKYRETQCPTALFSSFSRYERSIDWICCNVSNDEITAIYGHPREHYVNGRMGGVFVLDENIKAYLENNPGYMKNINVGGMPPDEAMLEQSLQMMIEDGKSVIGVKAAHPLIDIDKPWHLMEANEEIILQEVACLEQDIIDPSAKIHSSAVIEGKLKIGKNSYIGKNVIIKGNAVIGDNTIIDYGAIIEGNVVIGNNTSIKDYCKILPITTIGDKNRIGYNAEFQGITFEGVSMTHGSEMYGIVGEYTDIAAGCIAGILRFDDSLNSPKVMGKAELGGKYTNGIFLGDHCRTGIGNLFMPGVMIGKNSALGPGAIISKNVPQGTLLIVEQSQTYKSWGPERYGW
jgi:NDP-sugar pyrophosphorylase family protein